MFQTDVPRFVQFLLDEAIRQRLRIFRTDNILYYRYTCAIYIYIHMCNIYIYIYMHIYIYHHSSCSLSLSKTPVEFVESGACRFCRSRMLECRQMPQLLQATHRLYCSSLSIWYILLANQTKHFERCAKAQSHALSDTNSDALICIVVCI